MYLFDCFKISSARASFLALCEESEFFVDWDESNRGGGINSYLRLYSGITCFQLSEFPGNCSALVLSDFEHLHRKEIGQKILDFCIEFCEGFQYKLLFVTGTNYHCKEWLVERRFKIALNDIYNPHSGNDNYFAVLEI